MICEISNSSILSIERSPLRVDSVLNFTALTRETSADSGPLAAHGFRMAAAGRSAWAERVRFSTKKENCQPVLDNSDFCALP